MNPNSYPVSNPGWKWEGKAYLISNFMQTEEKA